MTEGPRLAEALLRFACLVDYRPTSRLTGKPLRLTAPGLGLCPMTRPRSDRLVRTRRTLPTEQLALRIRCLAC